MLCSSPIVEVCGTPLVKLSLADEDPRHPTIHQAAVHQVHWWKRPEKYWTEFGWLGRVRRRGVDCLSDPTRGHQQIVLVFGLGEAVPCGALQQESNRRPSSQSLWSSDETKGWASSTSPRGQGGFVCTDCARQ